MPGRTCVVCFNTPDAKVWSHVTAASSTFEAVREAWEFFHDPFWRGPKPTPETIFEISLIGGDRKWYVTGWKAMLKELDGRRR